MAAPHVASSEHSSAHHPQGDAHVACPCSPHWCALCASSRRLRPACGSVVGRARRACAAGGGRRRRRRSSSPGRAVWQGHVRSHSLRCTLQVGSVFRARGRVGDSDTAHACRLAGCVCVQAGMRMLFRAPLVCAAASGAAALVRACFLHTNLTYCLTDPSPLTRAGLPCETRCLPLTCDSLSPARPQR